MPFLMPWTNAFLVFITPFGCQFIQCHLSCLFDICLVKGLQISHKGFLILTDHITQAIADLVNNAKLCFCMRKYRSNCFREAFKPINAYATVLQIGEYAEPILAPSLSDRYKSNSSLWPSVFNPSTAKRLYFGYLQRVWFNFSWRVEARNHQCDHEVFSVQMNWRMILGSCVSNHSYD